MKSKYIVFICRAQPFHNGHKAIIEKALEESEKIIVVIGSYRASMSIRNPFTYEQRRDMILNSMPEVSDRLIFIPLRDFMYSDTAWKTSLQAAVNAVTGNSNDVKIIGHFKDDTSWYLKSFPQWNLVICPNVGGINATDIRRECYEKDSFAAFPSVALPGGKRAKFQPNYPKQVPPHVLAKLQEWQETDSFKALQKDYLYIQDYKKQWSKSPFPPTFVTTDAVVIQGGHVLVVRRKINPGAGKIALPGGFLGISETILSSCIRELYEETGIDLPAPIIQSAVVEQKVFDHPLRSSRGRTITHGFMFKLDDTKPLPNVKGGDDAAEAFWMPFADVALYEPDFFEDHVHIINYFINKV